MCWYLRGRGQFQESYGAIMVLKENMSCPPNESTPPLQVRLASSHSPAFRHLPCLLMQEYIGSRIFSIRNISFAGLHVTVICTGMGFMVRLTVATDLAIALLEPLVLMIKVLSCRTARHKCVTNKRTACSEFTVNQSSANIDKQTHHLLTQQQQALTRCFTSLQCRYGTQL